MDRTARRAELDRRIDAFAAEIRHLVVVEGGLIDPDSDGYHVLTRLSGFVLPRRATYHAPFHRVGLCGKVVFAAPTGRILMGRRAAHMAEGGKWDFPAGNHEPGETPEGVARREALEECGIEPRLDGPPLLVRMHVLDYGFEKARHHLDVAYLELLAAEVPGRPSPEMSEWRWVSEADIAGGSVLVAFPEVNAPVLDAAFGALRGR